MNRLRLAWHVLRGRPLLYGVHFYRGDGVVNIALQSLHRLRVEACGFDGGGTGTGLAVKRDPDSHWP